MVLLVRAPLILFDGVCNLCNAWVRFVVRVRDVPAATDCRKIVILRFFVRDAFVSNLEELRPDVLFGNGPLGTKGVFCISKQSAGRRR